MRSAKILSIAATALCFLGASSARADDMYLWAEEVGDDVVFHFEGSIDLAGFPSGTATFAYAVINPAMGIAAFGVPTSGIPVDFYQAVIPNSGEKVFGTGSYQEGDSVLLPDGAFGITSNILILPDGYTSQTPIAGSMTFLSTDLATLGVDTTPFTFDTTVGTNTIHMFTDPSTLPPVLPPANENAFANASEKSALFRGIKGLQKKARKLKKKGKKAKAKKLLKKVKKLKKQLAALG